MTEIRFGCYQVIEKTKTSITLKTDGGRIKVLTPSEYRKLTAKVAIEAKNTQSKAMKFVFKGETISLYDWATRFGIAPGVALDRIQAGQTIEQCLYHKTAKYLHSNTSPFIHHINDGKGNALCKPSSSKLWIGTNSARYICGSCRKRNKKLSTKSVK